MIRDQRHLFTGMTLTTQAEVRLVWEQIADQRGITLHETNDVVRAYVNHGRWVADCPNPDCSPDGRGSEAAWPEHDRWACLTCGVVCDVEFVDDKGKPLKAETIEKADVVLSAREHPSSRNWYPDTETLDRLQAETILMDARVPGGLPHDFAGIVGPNGKQLRSDELLPEFDRALNARFARELTRGRR